VSRTLPILVSPEWLEAHLEDTDLCLADVRGKVLPVGSEPRYVAQRAEYDATHIPGAVFVDWTRDIVDPDDPVPVQIARPGAFAARMGDLGIGDGTTVVAYDDYDHAFAGRFAWALRYYGHEAVSILDGGWKRWVAEGRPVSSAATVRRPAAFTAGPRPALRRTADQVEDSLGQGGILLIDARSPEQYGGKVSAAKRLGHIPGARNVPYARLVDPSTGSFLPPAELARVFEQAGIDLGNLPPEIVVYCNGGVTCTVPLHALRLLGRDDVAVYDGSWNEWGNDPQRPIVRGPDP
jgi:thiosulfate/3-mercaptopyruvate sulfurtransferase